MPSFVSSTRRDPAAAFRAFQRADRKRFRANWCTARMNRRRCRGRCDLSAREDLRLCLGGDVVTTNLQRTYSSGGHWLTHTDDCRAWLTTDDLVLFTDPGAPCVRPSEKSAPAGRCDASLVVTHLAQSALVRWGEWAPACRRSSEGSAKSRPAFRGPSLYDAARPPR